MVGILIEIFRVLNCSIMNHTNQEDASRNQGAAGSQKKVNKGQNGRNETTDQQDVQSRGTRDHSGGKSGDASNWQKDKQSNKK